MKICYLLLLLFAANKVLAQQILPYKNAALPVSQRVEDLLSRMTTEEKFWQLFMIPNDIKNDTSKYHHGIFGLQLNTAGSTDASQQLLQYNARQKAAEMAKAANSIQRYFVTKSRLGIPIIFFDEALHGLTQKDATVFPQAIALAATWDTALMRRVSTAIMEESRARGIRQILSPVVNIADDVRWGRTEETYGEDPFLCSQMGIAFVRSFEQNGIITTPKHFIANNGSGGRDSYPIHWNNQLMQEIYLPPFLACIKEGGSRSVMMAYNSVAGRPATASSHLQKDILKKQFGLSGFIISDASAVGGANVLHYTAKDYEGASAQSINNGLDVIFQTAYDHHKLFMPPFTDGRVNKKDMDDAVRRVLKAKMELGLFENPYVNENINDDAFQNNGALAAEAASAGAVLLKNEKQTLPLGNNIRSIALIGSDAIEARTGGYSGPGKGNQVSILQGLQKHYGNKVRINYAKGTDREAKEYEPIPAKYLSVLTDGKRTKGLLGEYFSNIDLRGPATIKRIDEQINFRWTLYPPDTALTFGFYSARWSGSLLAPETGKFKIGIEGNDGYRLYINNKLVIDNWKKQSYSTQLTDVDLVKGHRYDIRVEFYESAGFAHIKLVWNAGVTQQWKTEIAKAVQAAKLSDVAIITAGIEEGEGRDRAILSLPGHQEALIDAIAATGKPVIVLLVGGSAITMSRWLKKVNAAMQVWYPGEEGGNAIAALLSGNINPSGRLPITIPVHEGQLPLVYNHKPTGRNDDYYNLTGLPLFPFGFGLSYSSFSYSDLQFSKRLMSKDDTATVSFTLRNTGQRAGAEVVQLYIKDDLASLAQPVKALKAFQKVYLQPGENKRIEFAITPKMLQLYNSDDEWVVEPGTFTIMVAQNALEIKLMGKIEVR